MLRDRYGPMDLFAFIPTPSLAMGPILAQLDRLLEDDVLFRRVKADRLRRAPHTATRGRPSTPVEVILRMPVVKRLYHWRDEETAHFVADSLALRQFCRVSLAPVPDETTLLRWAHLIEPTTLTALNDRVIALARLLKVPRGRKLRVDSTVAETNRPHPTASGLLGDGVRVLSRLWRRATSVIGQSTGLSPRAFRSHMRGVRRLRRQRHRLARRKGEEATAGLQQAYGWLIRVARRTCAQAAKVSAVLREQASQRAQRLVRQFEQFLPRVTRVIDQTVRRVVQGEVVPARDKLVGIFEPHPQSIVRRETGRSVEFGRKIRLEEVDGGLISGDRSLAEAGQDCPGLPDSLVAHQQRFGRPPGLLAADRGVYSAANEAVAQQAGVPRLVIPYAGKAPPARVAQERAAWFRRGFRFRAGIEGRISVLRRRFGLDRCREHGEAGLGRWVGWGILTANLAKIAHTFAGRSALPRARAA
jgi:transposase, IS5 family